MNSYVTTLKSMKLKEKNFAVVLYPIILKKLPPQLAERFLDQTRATKPETTEFDATTEKLEEPDFASLDLAGTFNKRLTSLMNFMLKQTEKREQINTLLGRMDGKHSDESRLHSKDPKPNGPFKQTEPRKLACPFCKESHFPSKCNSEKIANGQSWILFEMHALRSRK